MSSSRIVCSLFVCLGLGAPLLFGAKKTADATVTLPVLVTRDGGKPKWSTVDQLKQFAAKGDPQACFELAERFLYGDEVPKDIKRAIPLFEQAAAGGIANAWFRLGKIQHDGLAGAPDYNRALDYYSLAARAGVPEAQYNIGSMLVSARGVKRDFVEGLAWLIIASHSGADAGAETQVRKLLAKRPADVQAAETRAKELVENLAAATVNAVRKLAPKPLVANEVQKSVPEPIITHPVAKPIMEKPVMAAPQLNTPPPPLKISLPPVAPPTLPSAEQP